MVQIPFPKGNRLTKFNNLKINLNDAWKNGIFSGTKSNTIL